MSRLRQVKRQVLITIIIALLAWVSCELRLGNSWDATTILQSVGALADTIIILDLMNDLTKAYKTTVFIEK